MEDLIIEATRSSPEIRFDAVARRLTLRGESYPENAAAFYAPVFAWVQALLDALRPAEPVEVELEIGYLNSSSTKVILNLLDLLDLAAQKGASIRVTWRYDSRNESALECGEDFSEELTAVEFRLVEIEAGP
ncbi:MULTISPECIES: DUF1987 domain-containing protein [unclassified Thiocapsa]|uniref:DUF1987 domain-containing protein n=1 Tax=unclassified Thiocapsa TaxID=2641286 RepID=UPI0035B1390A